MKLTIQALDNGKMHVTVDLQTSGEEGLQGWAVLRHQPGLTLPELQAQVLLRLSDTLSKMAQEIRNGE
jgi:hypothetical protein